MPDTTPSYVPGVCNINRTEIAYRKKAGYAGLAVLVVTFAALLALDVSSWFRLVLFVPAFVAAIGFLQARNKFCVAYGAAGKQNAVEGTKEAVSVTDKLSLVRDKIKVRSMNLQAAVIALGVALLACLI